MAINIRLSPTLEALARQYCERVGISLNSLVGVSLDAYLRQSERPSVASAPEPPASVPGPSPAPVVPSAPPDPALLQRHRDLKAEEQQRIQRFRELKEAQQGLAPSDPKPVLPANPTKADRTRLAQWHQRNPSK